MEQEKKWIAVTGISGRIGQKLAERLNKKYWIAGLDLKDPPEIQENVKFFRTDLTSEDSVKNVLEAVKEKTGGRLASVVHLAAYYSFTEKESPRYDAITVQGTCRLVEALKDFAVEQFMFSSTMLVHKPCKPGQKINEDWPLEGSWGYPRSKIETETLLQEKCGGMPLAILRIAGCYDHECHSIPLSNQIQRIYEGRLTGHVYSGDPRCGQSFLHFDDLIAALERTIDRRSELPAETILLLGEPEAIGYGRLQERISELIHGKKWQTYTVPKLMAKSGAWLQDKMPFLEESFIKPWMVDLADIHYDLDVSRAEKYLGWRPKHRLLDVIPAMIDYLMEDPAAFYRQNNLKLPSRLQKEAA